MPDFKFFGPGVDAWGPYAVAEPPEVDPDADDDDSDDDSDLDFDDSDIPRVVDPSKEPTDTIPVGDPPGGSD